jgi:hypothetical protein
VLNRPFQNAGELGYAYNPITGNTLDFRTAASSDATLLDFFTYNATDNTATYHLPYPLRAGPVNVNTRNSAVIAAVLKSRLAKRDITHNRRLAERREDRCWSYRGGHGPKHRTARHESPTDRTARRRRH